MKYMSYNNEPIPGLHPFLGFITSIGLLIAAKYIHILNIIIETIQPVYNPMRIPPIFLDILQGLAYTGTATIGLVTILKFVDERRGKSKKTKK